jgi:transposase InsO family protein
MAAANPLWRAPRVHGELKILGINISERTVSRILRGLRPRPRQTFLHNHAGQTVAIDFFTVPTVTMKVLFVFFVLERRRREVLHFNVTEHPTAAWSAQQIVEAFADREAARFLIRDRDIIYGNNVRLRIQSLGIKEVLTAFQSPWQNPYAQRLIGSIRTECLNHFVVLNPRHLKATLSCYFRYYHQSRSHLSLGKQCPFPRQVSSSGESFPFPNSVVFIIVMNLLHRKDLCSDRFIGEVQRE